MYTELRVNSVGEYCLVKTDRVRRPIVLQLHSCPPNVGLVNSLYKVLSRDGLTDCPDVDFPIVERMLAGTVFVLGQNHFRRHPRWRSDSRVGLILRTL